MLLKTAQNKLVKGAKSVKNVVGSAARRIFKITYQTTISVRSNQIRPAVALPFMVFNGWTTFLGAQLLLPFPVGHVVGFMLPAAYFIVVAIQRVKFEHPLRRLVLILIFFFGSTYTSFFSIYERLSDGRLQFLAVEKTVEAHNDFVDNMRTFLNQGIEKLEKENPTIIEIGQKQNDLERAKKKREEYKKSDNSDAAGNEAATIERRQQEIEAIQKKVYKDRRLTQNHQKHAKLLDLKAKYSKELTALDTEIFIAQNMQSSSLFSKDKSLYEEIKKSLEDQDSVKRTELDSRQPNSDDYVKTPNFLIPMETALKLKEGKSRQFSFVLFSAIVAFFLEVIPVVLAGIRIPSDQVIATRKRANIKQSDITLDQSRPLIPFRSNNLAFTSSRANKKKTILNQISGRLSELVSSVKESISEVSQSFRLRVGMSRANLDYLSKRFSQSLALAKYDDQEEFIRVFYSKIDKSTKKVSLAQFVSDEEIQDRIIVYPQSRAASLVLDLMADSRVGWLSICDDKPGDSIGVARKKNDLPVSSELRNKQAADSSR